MESIDPYYSRYRAKDRRGNAISTAAVAAGFFIILASIILTHSCEYQEPKPAAAPPVKSVLAHLQEVPR